MNTVPVDSPFTEAECHALGTLAGLIIPASQRYGLPSADDPRILAMILTDASPLSAVLSEPLAAFTRIEAATPEARGGAFRQAHSAAARTIETLVAQCYYRDDRVMRSLSIERRPPFPEGYHVDQGDWSLLDPVRACSPIYRISE